MGAEAEHGMGAEPGGILGQGTWTTKGVQDGAPLPTPHPLPHVVGGHGQGKGVPEPTPFNLNSRQLWGGAGGGQTLFLEFGGTK